MSIRFRESSPSTVAARRPRARRRGVRERRRRRRAAADAATPRTAPEATGSAADRASRHAAPRLLPQRHPRPGDHRRRDRPLRGARSAPASTLEPSTFNSGTEVIEALFSGAVDASFIGPNPAINGYAKSDGEALRIVSGTTSGGASLVVREGIDDAGRPRRHDAGHAVARQHPGRRPAGVARRAGLRDRHQRRRRRLDHAAGQRRHAAAAFQAGSARRRLGARAVGHPPGRRRAAATSSSTRPSSGPTGSSSRPT